MQPKESAQRFSWQQVGLFSRHLLGQGVAFPKLELSECPSNLQLPAAEHLTLSSDESA